MIVFLDVLFLSSAASTAAVTLILFAHGRGTWTGAVRWLSHLDGVVGNDAERGWGSGMGDGRGTASS